MKDLASTSNWPTLAEVAEQFDCSEKTVRRWIIQGRIEAVRFGTRLIRINPASLVGTPMGPEGGK